MAPNTTEGTRETGELGNQVDRRSQNLQQVTPLAEQILLNDDETYLTAKRWMNHYGDERERGGPKDVNVARFITHNISGFPHMGSEKFLRLKEEVLNVDCAGFSEINRNWYKINAQDSLQRRMKNWWPRQKTNITWLKEPEWHSWYQQGGVSLTLASDKISKYRQERGEDSSGLGRWCWQTIEGHSETKTAIIQAYRPTRNTSNDGSTYRQQQAASGEINPIQVWDRDIIELVDTFADDGFQIILMGDYNTPLQGGSKLEKELNSRGIFDVVQKQFGYADTPNTHVRGAKPIDGIFASETIGVVRAGYDRGYQEISDHRAIWADFSMDTLLGVDRGDIVRPKAKKLQTSNRVRTERFNRIFMGQMRRHRLLERARELEEDIGESKQMTGAQWRKYESIDQQRCRATECAESRCAKLPSDESPFSAELKQAMGRSIIWKLIRVKMERNERIHIRWIIDKKKELGLEEHIYVPTTKEEAVRRAVEAYTEYREAKRNSPELRSEFLDLLIQQAEDQGETKKVKELREIKEREQLRDAHKRIKVAQGKQRGGDGVRFIHKIEGDGAVRTIKDKHKMEQEIMRANAAKLMSANESPIRQGELQNILTDNDYDQWEAFLRGEVQLPTQMEQGTRLWLEHFQGSRIQDEDVTITTDDYIKSWNRVREHTSCAPGAMHYGTFKSIKWCRPAAELHTIMARIPIQTGYTPSRWTKSVDSMLPKKPGEWRPHKLRLTSLLMPDFNHNNKILGRAAMLIAEKKRMIAPEQYGSRKKLSAEKHALNKRLLLDVMRIEKRPGVVCANDAKACYDRILHFAAYISMRKVGIKKEAVKSMLEPVRRLEHTVRTAYGDSETTYGGMEWESDPSGVCQGNGAGPAIWAIVSSPLFECLREQGYGAELYSAISRRHFHMSGFAFVDDADTVQTGELGETTETVMEKAQEELNLWEELIRATGGGLEGDKSDFAVVNFQWRDGKWTYEQPSENQKLTVRNGDGEQEPLKQLGPSQARRTLGVWQAVDGNEEEQTDQMQQKAATWARAIARSSLTRQDTVMGVRTSLYPSLTFGLMATTLSKEQCAEVFKPIRQGALPKVGYVRSMPRVVVHGPEKYGGVGIKDLHSLQGIARIKVMIDEAGTQTPTGQLLTNVIEAHTVEVGRSGTLFSQSYQSIHAEMTYSWIKSVMEFTDENGIRLQGKTPTLQTWREDDSMLMDDIEATQGITIHTEDRAAFHRCRMHLRVATLSDITDGHGQHVLPAAWEVKQTWKTISSEAYRWPYYPPPSKKDKEAWQRVLTQVYNIDNRTLETGRNLGPYYRKTRRYTNWMYDNASDSLYQRNGQRWDRWSRQPRRTRTKRYISTGERAVHAEATWETAVVTLDRGQRADFWGSGRNTRDTTPRDEWDVLDTEGNITRTTSLQAAVRRLPHSIKWVVERLRLPQDNGRAIATAIIKGKGKCISDSAVKDELGTSSAFYLDVPRINTYEAHNRTPGADIDTHSFRGELCGILANMVMTECVAKVHGITEGTVTIGCDNESALWVSFGNYDVKAGDSSFDIIRVIRNYVDNSPITWKPLHVKGHQDDNPEATLDAWAKANIRADSLAGAQWRIWYGRGDRTRPTPPRMPGEGWRVSIDDRPLVSLVDDQLYNHIYYDRCMQYWESKGRLHPDMGKQVEWTQYYGALKLLPQARRQWTHKHFCGFEGTNSMMHKWGQRTTPTCPSCAEKETHRHVVQCQSDRATKAYREIERNFETWLHATTSKDIREAIMAHLDAYREQSEVEHREGWEEEVMHASKEQERLGPNAFVEGLVISKWEDVQRTHMDKQQSKRNPSRWVREMIKKLWNVSWDMWDARNGDVHRNTQTRKEHIIAQLDNKENGEGRLSDVWDQGRG